MPSLQAFSVQMLLALAALVAVAVAVWSVLRSRARTRAILREGRLERAAAAESRALNGRYPVEENDPDLLERRGVARLTADLMMSDEWTQLGDQIAEWERTLESTPGGLRFHDVGVKTALSGLKGLIDEMPRTALADLKAAEDELGHFLDTHRRSADCHVLALLAARAHLMIGEACRAEAWPEELHRDLWRRMAKHFVQAGEILSDFDPLAYMSPLLAEAHYLQALGSPGGAHRLQQLFEDWIDLDPSNPLIYERHADFLADDMLVDDASIMAEADKALARTEGSLGFGGYALFFLPLLSRRDGARSMMDDDLFASAVFDLASMSASQAEVNQAANVLAVEMNSGEGSLAMRDMFCMIVQSQLEVIYPRLWSLPLAEVQALVSGSADIVTDEDDYGTVPLRDAVMSRAA